MRSGWRKYSGLPIMASIAMVFQGCERHPSIHSLNADTTLVIEGAHRELANSSKARVAEVITALRMPTNPHRYALQRPVLLVDLPGNPCTFLVGDAADQALHTYSIDGTYLGSIDGAGTDSTAFPELTSAAATANGTIAISDLYNRSVVVIHRSGTRRVLHLAPVYPNAPSGSQVAIGADNTLYENWFAHNVPTLSSAWPASLPLVRAFTAEGQFLTTFGHVTPRDGKLFTAALNRGILRIQSDTAWFARRADGRIFAYSLARRTDEPVREIEVPIYYRMRQPAEFVSADEKNRNVRVENHIVAFNVTSAGEFVVAVATQYPHNDDEIFRPSTLIAILSREGQITDLIDPRGQVIDMLAKGPALVAIVIRGDGR